MTEYHLFKRRSKKGKVSYYVGFLGKEKSEKTGRPRYQAVRNTGTGNKAEARKRVQEMIETGEVFVSRDDLRSFLLDFWTPDSQYVRSKKAEGRKLSTVYIANSKALIENHILPWFKEHSITEFADLNLEKLTDWRNYLFDSKLSPTTVNHARIALFTPLRWAVSIGKVRLPFDPSAVKPVAKQPTARQIFTLAECEKLWAQKWDPRYRAACMLSAATGMRLGETRGLQVKNLHLDQGYVDVLTSFQDREGLKECKWGSARENVPILPYLVDLLRELVTLHPWGAEPDDFVFFGESRDRPASKEAITAGLQKAMGAAGISGRTFHCFRHSWASYSNKLSSGARRYYIGHTNESTFAGYDHPTEADRKALRKLQARILPFKKAI
jgi:integrase